MIIVDAETERIVGQTFTSRANFARPFSAEWRDQAECRRRIIITPSNAPRAQWYFVTEEEARWELMLMDLERVPS